MINWLDDFDLIGIQKQCHRFTVANMIQWLGDDFQDIRRLEMIRFCVWMRVVNIAFYPIYRVCSQLAPEKREIFRGHGIAPFDATKATKWRDDPVAGWRDTEIQRTSKVSAEIKPKRLEQGELQIQGTLWKSRIRMLPGGNTVACRDGCREGLPLHG